MEAWILSGVEQRELSTSQETFVNETKKVTKTLLL